MDKTPQAIRGTQDIFGAEAEAFQHVVETFELDAAAEAELLESIAEADRGETVPAEEVLRALRNLE